MAASKWPLAITLATAGIMYGLLMGFIGILLAGAGHGWVSGVWSGLAAFVLLMFGIVLVYRDHTFGRVLVALVMAGMIGVDCLLIYMAWNEGSYYLLKLWTAPGGLLLWLIWLSLWLVWQVAVLVVELKGRKWGAAVPGTFSDGK